MNPLSKTAIFTITTILRKKLHNWPERVGIFGAGALIEHFYLNHGDIFLNIMQTDISNLRLQNFIFSTAFQTLILSLLYDDSTLISDDIINSIITYAVTLPTNIH